MLLVRITGNQLRAGRALAGLTIEDLATRAQLHWQSMRTSLRYFWSLRSANLASAAST